MSDTTSKESLQTKINELEAMMMTPDFWVNKDRAQAVIREIGRLKDELQGVGKYDKGDALITIYSGAGGDDAEDFSAMLFRMYSKYADSKGWGMKVIDSAPNDHGGYRNMSAEVTGSGAYGTLKNEAGVHRLVRISPFNAKKLRQTSFSLVEIVPKFEKISEMPISPDELKIEFSKSSGPGGQNVNKRETAVRIVHIPTNLSAASDGERSQAQNKERALQLLTGKLYAFRENERKQKEKGMYVSKTTDIEWGNQIRSYVLHPYKMVKDHRTEVETAQADKVLDGDLDKFIEAEKML